MKKHLFILLSVFCVNIWAVPVANLYQAQVPVTARANNLQISAIQQALQEVLTKVSGNSQAVVQTDDLQQAMKSASSYVQRYSYNRNLAQNNAQFPWLVNISFQPSKVNQLLKQLGQNVWPKDRPLVLAWVVVDDGQNRVLMGADNTQVIDAGTSSAATDIIAKMQKIANKRGLPLVLPVLDITDVTQVTANDVWGSFLQPIEKASARYSPNAILLLRISKVDNEVRDSQWTLVVGDQQQTWQINSDQQPNITQTGMDNVIDALASRYAMLGQGTQEKLTLTITNINSLYAYANVQKYLQQLAPVTAVDLVSLRANQAQFLLSVQGTEQDLQRAISLDRTLTSVGLEQPIALIPSQLQYRLR